MSLSRYGCRYCLCEEVQCYPAGPTAKAKAKATLAVMSSLAQGSTVCGRTAGGAGMATSAAVTNCRCLGRVIPTPGLARSCGKAVAASRVQPCVCVAEGSTSAQLHQLQARVCGHDCVFSNCMASHVPRPCLPGCGIPEKFPSPDNWHCNGGEGKLPAVAHQHVRCSCRGAARWAQQRAPRLAAMLQACSTSNPEKRRRL